MKDKYLIVISIFIGILMWFYVFTSENIDTTVSIPVVLVDEAADTIAIPSPFQVKVQFTGPQAFISKAKNAQIFVSVKDRPLGKSLVEINPKNIKSVGLGVVNIMPDVIEVDIMRTIKKNLRVMPVVTYEPMKGYKIENVSVFPERVTVEGSYADLNLMDSIKTADIPINNINETNEFTVTFPPYQGVKNIDPGKVKVTVTIAEDITYETYNSKLICLEGTASSKELPKITATVKGRRDILESIPADTSFAAIDCSLIHKGHEINIIPINPENDRYQVISTVPITYTPSNQ